MVKKYRRKRLHEPLAAGESIFDLLRAMGGSPQRGLLVRLWANWDEVLGERLASLAEPLGSKGSILLIKAEDALQMQELHFLCGELLEKANAFLGCEYFSSVRLTLFGDGKICRVEDVQISEKEEIVKDNGVSLTGEFLAMMKKESPVAACYKRFVRRRS